MVRSYSTSLFDCYKWLGSKGRSHSTHEGLCSYCSTIITTYALPLPNVFLYPHAMLACNCVKSHNFRQEVIYYYRCWFKPCCSWSTADAVLSEVWCLLQMMVLVRWCDETFIIVSTQLQFTARTCLCYFCVFCLLSFHVTFIMFVILAPQEYQLAYKVIVCHL